MKLPRTIFLVVVSTLILILLAEAVLYAAWAFTGSSKLGTLYLNSIHLRKERIANHLYPENPKQFLKVATFGSSSTEGLAAEANFAYFLERELIRRTGQKVYVRNYGRGGAAFHLDQAEIAKTVAPYYDVLVIYAGNNEPYNYYFRTGGYPGIGVIERMPWSEVIERRRRTVDAIRAEIEGRSTLLQFAERRSRIYAILWKITVKLAPSSRPEQHPWLGKLLRPPLTAPEKLLPEAELQRLGTDFEASLAELMSVARSHKTIVAVVPATGDELWPPYFSVGISDAVTDSRLKDAERALWTRRFDDAAAIADSVLAASPRHAFANYVRGMTSLETGDPARAWPYLVRAVDEDGYVQRSTSLIDQAARRTKERFPEMVYVGYPEAARRLIAQGLPGNILYADTVHPSMLGHVLIARTTLCALSDLSAFAQLKQGDYCRALDGATARGLDRDYRRDLRITPNEVNIGKMKVYGYALLLAQVSAHPSWYYAQMEELLPYLYGDPQSGPAPRARNAFWAAMLTSLRGDDCTVVARRLDEARVADAAVVTDILKRKSTLGHGYPLPAEAIIAACPALTGAVAAFH